MPYPIYNSLELPGSLFQVFQVPLGMLSGGAVGKPLGMTGCWQPGRAAGCGERELGLPSPLASSLKGIISSGTLFNGKSTTENQCAISASPALNYKRLTGLLAKGNTW